MPVGREHCGGRVRCTRCQATSLVSLLSSNTIQLKLLSPVTLPSGSPAAIVVEGPDGEPELDPSAATVVAEKPPAFVTAAALRAGFSRRWIQAGAIGGCALGRAYRTGLRSRRTRAVESTDTGPARQVAKRYVGSGSAGRPAGLGRGSKRGRHC